MVLTRAEENKNRIISLGISLLIFLILLLFLIFYVITVPNPPFPVSEGGGGGGIEFNIGNLIEGTGNVENNGIGEAVQVVESTETTPPANQENSSENLVTSEQGENINITKTETNNTETTPKTNQTVVIPVKPKVKTAAELLAEKFNKNKGQNGGGDGNSGHEGNDGRPDGNPNTNGNGGTGGGTGGGDGTGDGPGKGPGKGPGNGGYGFSLAGRAVISPPPLSKDTKEEGKVVVEITVDKNGKVIKADPNGRGTTTSSPILKAKARQAALATTFNVSGEFEEQKGTITIIFSF
ncbi:MAG: energy transducer TonB [Bacteroidia bacterium]